MIVDLALADHKGFFHFTPKKLALFHNKHFLSCNHPTLLVLEYDEINTGFNGTKIQLKPRLLYVTAVKRLMQCVYKLKPVICTLSSSQMNKQMFVSRYRMKVHQIDGLLNIPVARQDCRPANGMEFDIGFDSRIEIKENFCLIVDPAILWQTISRADFIADKTV